jgi:dipeptidase E
MIVDLHLLSTPGEKDIRYILEACRPYLEAQTHPRVAFMQWASVNNDWLPYTRQDFSELASVDALDPDPTCLEKNEQILDRCRVVYISGGNTYLLNHRLHESKLYTSLQQRALAGLPIVGFSAGAILCGPNILTTHDINLIPSHHFDSLNLLPYNVVAHYPSNDAQREDEDDWLSDYQAHHANPILTLEDGAYVRFDGQGLKVVRGSAWILEAGGRRILKE